MYRYTKGARLRLYAYDPIIEFASSGDYLVDSISHALLNVRRLGRVDALTRRGIGTVLTRSVFPVGTVAAFTFRSSTAIRSFLALNDGKPGFNARRDKLIEITGFSGNWRSLAIAGVNALLPVITLSVSPESVAEDGGAGLVYAFRRTGIVANRLSVNYAVAGSATFGIDYAGISALGAIKSIAFRPGAATASVIVNPIADSTVEEDETVVLTLVEGPGYAIGSVDAVTGTIVNDDFQDAARNLSFNISIDDPFGAYYPYHDLIQASVQAAGGLWDYYIEGFNVDLDVIVRFSDAIARATGRSLASSFVRNNGIYDVYEQGAASEIRTGVDPNGREHDIELVLNPDYLVRELWFEADPVLRAAPVPADRTDAVSVFMHELGHAFAFNGWMNDFTGVMSDRYQSVYDELIDFRGGSFYFTGSGAARTYGSPVPLSYGNITHLGNLFPGPGSDLIPDLMNGVVFYRGSRYNISPLNIAILADVGIPVVS
jgi:hypothetical protein